MIFLVIILYIFFTVMSFFQNYLISYAPYPLFIMGLRMLLSAFLGFMVQFIFRKPLLLHSVKRSEIILIFLQALALLGNFFSLFALSLHYIDSSTAAYIQILLPGITAALVYIFYKQTVSLSQIAAFIGGILLLIPIIMAKNNVFRSLHFPYHIYWGIGIYFLGIVLYAYRWILAKQLILVAPHILPSLSGAYAKIGVGITLLSIHAFFNFNHFIPAFLPEYFWHELFFYGVCTWIEYRLYTYLLNFYSVTFLSFASFLQPIFSLLALAIWYQKHVPIYVFISACMIVYVLYIFYQQEMVLQKKQKNLL